MPFIRSLVSKYYIKLVSTIILLGEIIPSYSYYVKRRLLYIVIAAPFSCQLFFYAKCTRANMRASYDICLVSNAEYMFFIYLVNF